MGLDAALLRSTFTLVVERNPNLTGRFYDILFARYPQVTPLFGRADMKRQQQMLASALGAVLDHLEDAPWLTTTLKALGAKHKDYGVTVEMYDWVGATLLATLAEAAGPDWSPAAKEAWTVAYGTIVSLMLAK